MHTKTLLQQSPQTEQRTVPAQPGLAGQRTPGPLGAAGLLLSLQRSHGNRFVQRLLDATVLRRGCGGGGTCADCGKDARAEEPDRPALQQTPPALPAFIQAKLTVSQPGDPCEQEADRVAEDVMRMPDPDTATSSTRSMQPFAIARNSVAREIGHLGRQTEVGDQPAADETELTVDSLLSFKEKTGPSHDIGPDLESRIARIRGGGEPMSAELRGFFEPRFGVDFGGVRIHTDSAAAETARSVGARAYTLGNDIVFAPSEFQANAPEGRKLLAHELTHVIQQGHGVKTVMRACDCTAKGKSAPPASLHTFLSGVFPNLKSGDYCVTAPATSTYNCIAWSIGNTSQWIWDEVDSVYGDQNGAVEISDFDAFYANEGLKPVVGSTPANPQVALYAVGSNPTHAARRTDTGACGFESKLGQNARIAHEVGQLEGGTVYGNINRYYV
jgi:hypothetical protein